MPPEQPRRFVPIVLPEDEARATLNAVRAVFAQLTAMRRASETPELARAMLSIATAIDKSLERT
jgi:hypothetical protein